MHTKLEGNHSPNWQGSFIAPHSEANGAPKAPTIGEVWTDSDAAVEMLRASDNLAVVVQSAWTLQEQACQFEHIVIYQQVAEDAGFVIQTCRKESAGGFEHLLLMVKRPRYTCPQLLERIAG